ncbi:replication termination factor 2-like [Hydractinia symbiolongicarpus]|uniref:replication termination factor 2-like n=1 Tax=Hydractinia symbiolongicarpus TaxID=13093 RepID=UPI00254FB69C|nr:replication termination factor 2-like [Hydractinia symbiolongicarpus]
MGCDGGTIPKRHELVKTAKRPEQKDKDMDRSAKWSNCTISQQALTTPIMTCELGKLYSKESVIEFLLDRTICTSAQHIRNLKDVKQLNLTENNSFAKRSSELADQYYDTHTSKYVCPVVGLEMNGKYKFCAIWTCGCVLSERALKEVETELCHKCGEKFSKDNIIVLNPDGEDVEHMETNMKNRREKMKALRKEKKEKKSKNLKEETKATNGSLSTAPNGFKMPAPPAAIGLKSTSANGEIKRKTSVNGEVKTHSKKANKRKSNEKSSDEVIDHTKSKVYKSLFTSGQKDRGSDQKAHWITYNPYHL